MAILVQLGPDFPLEKPVLSVSPNVSHPWVDHSGRITAAPGLLNVYDNNIIVIIMILNLEGFLVLHIFSRENL
jgi:hypothetical protein